MRDILEDLEQWRENEEHIAIATVIETWGSAPRRVGAKMGLTPDGKITGSVSGGCVEGAVFEAGTQVIETHNPRLLHFGVADETAWEVGLACGGNIEVFVEPLEHHFFDTIREKLRSGESIAVATIISGRDEILGQELLVAEDEVVLSNMDEGIQSLALEKVRLALKENSSRKVTLTHHDQKLGLFVDVISQPPSLVIVGGVHIAVALTSIAKALGYKTVVVDPRRAFGSKDRFPDVDKLYQTWPEDAFQEINLNESTAIAMLTHDPKIDDPALKFALNSQAFYIGALGSSKTQAKRRQRLQEMGFTEDQISRIKGPIGLNLGGRSPEEIALAIMAEIVSVKYEIDLGHKI